MFARTAVALAGSTLLPACLTQNVQFEPPRNYPPSIETPETGTFPHPLNSIIHLPDELAMSVVDGGVGSATEIPLSFEVRDANLDQRLEFRLIIDFNPATPFTVISPLSGPILPAGSDDPDRLTRRVDLRVPVALVGAPGCHRIEVFVAERLTTAAPFRSSLVEGDLAAAAWFVATQPEGGGVVDMTACP